MKATPEQELDHMRAWVKSPEGQAFLKEVATHTKIAETKITTSYQTTVPESIRYALNVKAGETLEWHIDQNEIKIKKAPTHQEATQPQQ